MDNAVDRDELNEALRRCGSNWSAEQAHGLLCSRLAVAGAEAGVEWLRIVLDESDPGTGAALDCARLLEMLFAGTHLQLSERQSEFMPLLAEDGESAEERATTLASWCEGYLHGLVSDVRSENLKERLAAEPLCDIIRDLLEMTRAAADDADDEEDEEAYTELVEYLRVAVQLAYEELADFRDTVESAAEPVADAPVLH